MANIKFPDDTNAVTPQWWDLLPIADISDSNNLKEVTVTSIKDYTVNNITLDDIADWTTNKAFTVTEKTKLAWIEPWAEVNTINDIVAWTNVTIDKTDPLNPIINVPDPVWMWDMLKATYDPQLIEADCFDRANHTWTQTASTISDFDTEVTNNTTVASNTTSTAKFETVVDITEEPTGFVEPENVILSYNSTTRKITMTWTTTAYYRWELVADLISWWESPAHSTDDWLYFLQYNPISWFTFTTSVFDFTNLLIALVYRDTANFCLRECHWLMQWQSHQHLHETIGTYLKSWWDLGNFTLNSTTATNRRPTVSQTTIVDEDLPTTLPALATNAYARLNLSWADVANLTVDNAEIIALDWNIPIYNLFTGWNWTQENFPVNAYWKIFVMAIPATADTDCQKQRYIFIQPQTANTSLSTIQQITTADVNLWHIANALSEYIFIGEIIIRYTSNNWQLIAVNKLKWNKTTQTNVPSWNYLSAVTTDATLTWDWTASNPLSVIQQVLTEYNNWNSWATATINWNNWLNQKITLTADCTLTLSNPVEWETYLLRIFQDWTGGRTPTFSPTIKPARTITTTASEYAIIGLYYVWWVYHSALLNNL